MIKDLFGTEIRETIDSDGRKITLIGRTEGKKCKQCSLFFREEFSKTFFRCVKNPNKSWKANFEACTFFQEKLKNRRKENDRRK